MNHDIAQLVDELKKYQQSNNLLQQSDSDSDIHTVVLGTNFT